MGVHPSHHPHGCSTLRIDKFLWCVRLAKTRSLASEWIKKDAVSVNGEVCKPSRAVKTGDLIGLRKIGIENSYRIVGIPPSRVSASLVENYLLNETRPEEIEKAEFLQMMRSIQRQRGTGRPTKKERRDIDRLQQGDDDGGT